ncbi:CoA-acylating methylmalonate-semialdehyde dehydrogenase [Treponema sp. OttesenSCG-928-L16]|nr:CoA-acylating methylmalonate-semialdehyde dehydrogenase [Treponema sp. OttesenSCG-928-L16]
MNTIQNLSYFCNGEWRSSGTQNWHDCYNPSTGVIEARSPLCLPEEIHMTIEAAEKAFPSWRDTPAGKRVQVLFKMKNLLDSHLDELALLCARENGKSYHDSVGDVLKVTEMVEYACGIQELLKAPALLNCTSGYDTTQYKEPLGVFAGIVPWNFPAMIPMGWIAPLCIACGNTLVLKLENSVPRTSMRIMELWQEAGLPNGVLNVITCSNEDAEILLTHPAIKGVSFIGSTPVGRHVYALASANGKRVQALTQAKNHALVLRDCDIKQVVKGVANAACGCAGERCMALSVLAVEDCIADELVRLLKEEFSGLKIGPAYDRDTKLGPVVSKTHKKSIERWIQKGVDEGARLILDGRNCTVPGFEDGFFLGPTIFDHVQPEMTIGDMEIFGPVLCIKRVNDFEEGLSLMNSNEFANGSVIYTSSGYYAREFIKRTHGGMVGVNVGIPVPLGIFGFTGHKNSFFGDLHVQGNDGVRFYTELKTVTQHWYSREEKKTISAVDTWDGMMILPK